MKMKEQRKRGVFWDLLVSGGSGGGSPGYTVTEESTTIIPEQSVTTAEQSGSYVAMIPNGEPDPGTGSLTVVWNGTTYECESYDVHGVAFYGAVMDIQAGTIDWSDYPFILLYQPQAGAWTVLTEAATTATVKASALARVVTPSADFESAVNSILPNTQPYVLALTANTGTGNYDYYSNDTIDAIRQAHEAGRTFYFDVGTHLLASVVQTSDYSVRLRGMNVDVVNNVLKVYEGSRTTRQTIFTVKVYTYTLTPPT